MYELGKQENEKIQTDVKKSSNDELTRINILEPLMILRPNNICDKFLKSEEQIKREEWRPEHYERKSRN